MLFSAIFVPSRIVVAFRVARDMLSSSKTGNSYDLMCCGHLSHFSCASSNSAAAGYMSRL